MHAPKAPPKQQPLACLCAKSDRLSTPLRWGLRLLQRCNHNRVASATLVPDLCLPNAMRSQPVSIIGVPTHDVQLRSALAVRINRCRPRNPSDNLWDAGSPTQQQINCVVPERRAHQVVALLSPPLEEWCGRPLHHPPKYTVKVARGIGPQKKCAPSLHVAQTYDSEHASLDTRSNAPIPSTDKTVLSGWKAWMACPTHSVPERVDREHPGMGRCYPLHGCSNLLAANLDTAPLNVSPTTMPLTPPMGSRKAVIDPNGSLPPPRGVVSRAHVAPSNVCLTEKRSSPNSTKTCARFCSLQNTVDCL